MKMEELGALHTQLGLDRRAIIPRPDPATEAAPSIRHTCCEGRLIRVFLPWIPISKCPCYRQSASSCN